jgi:hypothetical protein
MKKFYFFIFLFFIFGCNVITDTNKDNSNILHKNIISTYFYIGEDASKDNDNIDNISSAWDENWSIHYGGIDDPNDRNQSFIYYPATFIPKENPFYVALPYNDFDDNGNKKPDLKKIIPWYIATYQSLMKNRWVKITKNDKTVYAQIEDAGPFEYNDWQYVFGPSNPINTFGAKAGIDVSPAVKLYLGLKDVDKVDWKFVNSDDVPDGPWKNIITTRGVTWLNKTWPQFDINTTAEIQLTNDINTSYDVNLYDIDLFDTPTDTIDELHKEGRKVICYFSAGSYEDWREDKNEFPQEAIGKKMADWDENWLDIRNKKVREIMKKRLDLAKIKGCDGVDADNVDGYTNDTGFNLTYQDQLKYNIFLAYEAHKRGLSIGLKNDLNQINDLSMYFDFAINEQCYEYNECNLLTPFVLQNKPVFNIEYTEDDSICDQSDKLQIQTIFLPKNLDGSFRNSCH